MRFRYASCCVYTIIHTARVMLTVPDEVSARLPTETISRLELLYSVSVDFNPISTDVNYYE